MKKLLEHTRRSDVSFSRNGTIRITARVARAIHLCPGDALNIAVANGEFLLHAIHIANTFSRHEAQCYPSKKGSGNYCANSVRLCRSLLDTVGIPEPKASFMVGEAFQRENTTYVPIITAHPL